MTAALAVICESSVVKAFGLATVRGLAETAAGFDQGVGVNIDLSGLAGATVVFDLDGTLVESAPDLVATLNVLLAQEGAKPLPLSEARNMIGQGARALLAKGFAAEGILVEEPRLSELFERFIAHYREHIADASYVFPGVEAALDTLQGAGATLAVCTNKRTDLSLSLLGELGLIDRFAAIISTTAQKPDFRVAVRTQTIARLPQATHHARGRAAGATGPLICRVLRDALDLQAVDRTVRVVSRHDTDNLARCLMDRNDIRLGIAVVVHIPIAMLL
jgi:phosphoglycolate phosphatase-like HAD superfamily hydrolase